MNGKLTSPSVTDAMVDAACGAWWDTAPALRPGIETVGERMRIILEAAMQAKIVRWRFKKQGKIGPSLWFYGEPPQAPTDEIQVEYADRAALEQGEPM